VKNPVPEHLSDAMKAFYRHVKRTYPLAEHHRYLLLGACEAADRQAAARALIAREGLTVTDRHGQQRPHPAVAIESDSAIRFARLLREIGLSEDVEDARPPALRGRYARRK
jgi:P27 family predicted phage terminase small subunit